MVFFAVALLVPGALRGLPKPDVIVGSTVHPFAALAASLLASRRSVPFIFEIRDLWPETFVSMGLIGSDHLFAKSLYRLEALLIDRAAAVVGTMPKLGTYLAEVGFPEKRVEWISNGVSTANFTTSVPTDDHKFLVTYFGTFGRANAVDLLVRGFAAAAERDDALRLRLIGSGPTEMAIRELVSSLGMVDRVEMTGRIPKAAVAVAASTADVLALSMLPLSVYRYGVSLNKLFEYLALGRPILFAGSGVSEPMRALPGVHLVNSHPDDIARGLVHLRGLGYDGRRAMGAANRTAAEEQFDWSVLAARYKVVLEDVADRVVVERVSRTRRRKSWSTSPKRRRATPDR